MQEKAKLEISLLGDFGPTLISTFLSGVQKAFWVSCGSAVEVDVVLLASSSSWRCSRGESLHLCVPPALGEAGTVTLTFPTKVP